MVSLTIRFQVPNGCRHQHSRLPALEDETCLLIYSLPSIFSYTLKLHPDLPNSLEPMLFVQWPSVNSAFQVRRHTLDFAATNGPFQYHGSSTTAFILGISGYEAQIWCASSV